ncbi:Flagellar motor switch protein FliN [Planctomycetes bacterium MalM25]|nr:Flagellar motor switch protein FliN [Planctomycetes bacterium MalM25]
MAELTPELADQVLAACTTNGEEAAGAIGRAFDGEYVLKPGEASPAAGLTLEGPGLALAFKFGEESLFAALPAGEGLVPEWVREPDPTGASKLSTLSQELSMLLVPDTLMADVFEAAWVNDLAAALGQAAPAEDATALPIEVACGEKLGQLTLVWAVADAPAALKAPDAEQPADETAEEPTEQADTAPTEDSKPRSRVLRWKGPSPRDYRDLPPNAVSALQVKADLAVNLAGKKMPLGEVVEIGPGSIITFDKVCHDPLEIELGGQAIAKGDAVKVGERFGVRITEMILPDERFRPMLPPESA